MKGAKGWGLEPHTVSDMLAGKVSAGNICLQYKQTSFTMKFNTHNIVLGGYFFCFSILSTFSDMLKFNFKICNFQGHVRNINIKVCNKFACHFVPVCLSVCLSVCLLHFSAEKRVEELNTLRTGDADLRFYITTVQDG